MPEHFPGVTERDDRLEVTRHAIHAQHLHQPGGLAELEELAEALHVWEISRCQLAAALLEQATRILPLHVGEEAGEREQDVVGAVRIQRDLETATFRADVVAAGILQVRDDLAARVPDGKPQVQCARYDLGRWQCFTAHAGHWLILLMT